MVLALSFVESFAIVHIVEIGDWIAITSWVRTWSWRRLSVSPLVHPCIVMVSWISLLFKNKGKSGKALWNLKEALCDGWEKYKSYVRQPIYGIYRRWTTLMVFRSCRNIQQIQIQWFLLWIPAFHLQNCPIKRAPLITAETLILRSTFASNRLAGM